MRSRSEPRSTIGVGDRTLGPDPVLVGILNVTPDSFSDGGEFLDPAKAASHAATMLDEGAGIIDVGGESTRPGSDPIPREEEARRVVPVIERILSMHPNAVVSIDTYRAATAEAALQAGARMVNDVSALRGDPRMAEVVADARCPVVLMHMLGEPKTMQRDPATTTWCARCASSSLQGPSTLWRQVSRRRTSCSTPASGSARRSNTTLRF